METLMKDKVKLTMKMPKKNLEISRIMDNKYKRENGKYNIKKALDECEFIRNSISDKPNEPLYARENNLEDQLRLQKLLAQVKKSIEKKIVKECFPRIKPYNRLSNGIENLIVQGEWNKKNIMELKKSCHLYGDEGREVTKEFHERISKALKPKVISQLRLFKKQQPLKGRRTIKRPKPFDKFSISLVLAAKEKEIITGEEARILNYRYGLDDQGIRSLRLIEGWLGISHTSVRNIEIKALKKMKEHIREIEKSTPIKEPIGRDITKEEYKRRFGHYPDFGRK